MHRVIILIVGIAGAIALALAAARAISPEAGSFAASGPPPAPIRGAAAAGAPPVILPASLAARPPAYVIGTDHLAQDQKALDALNAAAAPATPAKPLPVVIDPQSPPAPSGDAPQPEAAQEN